MNGLAGFDVLPNDADDGLHGVGALGNELVDALLEVTQCLGYGRIEHDEGCCAVGRRADGTKLESITREGEWARAVAVGVVEQQFRHLGNVERQRLLTREVEEAVVVAFLEGGEQVGELFAKE